VHVDAGFCASCAKLAPHAQNWRLMHKYSLYALSFEPHALMVALHAQIIVMQLCFALFSVVRSVLLIPFVP
jgi:hypothetical protein